MTKIKARTALDAALTPKLSSRVRAFRLLATGSWLLASFLGAVDFSITPSERWTEKAANKWYSKQPWFVGSNYITSNAINQIEMWQGDTFDPPQIDKELGWGEALGMNTMRVFLHDLVWQ